MNNRSKSLFLAALMVMFSFSPILTSPFVSAEEAGRFASWPLSGSNDTGWVQLDATGADPMTGTGAYVDFELQLPPGAEVSNVSVGLMADGANGISIDEPMMHSIYSSDVLFDWSGYGSLGTADSFSGNNPHISRMAPFSDNGAGWLLPTGAQVDDLVIEALAPVDPIVSFTPYSLEIMATAIHPEDGRMYMAVGNSLLLLDANSDPLVIDLLEFPAADEIFDLDVDVSNDRLLITTRDDGIHAVSLTDGSDVGALPQSPVPDDWMAQIFSNGSDLFAASEEGIFSINSAGSGWTMERASGTTDWPAGEPTDIYEIGGVLYVSIWGGGIARWDMVNNQPLSVWNTANNLQSDEIHDIHDTGSQLLFSSYDEGVSRYNHQGGFWQSTWSDSNWISSNQVVGSAQSGNTLGVLAGDNLHMYDTTVGSFTTTYSLNSLGLVREGMNLALWPAGGSRAPATDQILVSDGSGRLVVMEPTSSPLQQSDIVIASGPSGLSMHDVLQEGNIVWIAVDEYIDRFDISAQEWLQPLDLGSEASALTSDGSSIFVATEDRGVVQINRTSAMIVSEWNTSSGLNADIVTSLSTDGDWLVIGHPSQGVTILDLQSGSVDQTWSNSNGLDTNRINDVAILDGIAYLAQDEGGISRIDIVNQTELSPWRSTGVDQVQEAPIVVTGNILYMGLYGYGVIRKNLQTGQFLETWGNRQLPSLNIFALDVDSSGHIWIGTQGGARVWDGQSMNNVNSGNGWPRPTQFFDFDNQNGVSYAATNAGICKYSTSTYSLDECWEDDDGLPSNWMKEVKLDGNNLFAGSWYGAALIDLTTEEVVQSWEAGEQTGNAVTEIIGDIAYVGLYNMGVARFNLTTSEWLPMWVDGSGGLLDTDQITSIAADTNPNRIWVGGTDGFQCLDWVNGTEEIDIEKSSSIFTGNGDPVEIIIDNGILHYIPTYYSGDNVHRIDITTLTKLSSLDAGQQAGISGYIHGFGIVGGNLAIGVGPSWNSDAQGAVALWNLSTQSWESNWDVTGSVERVEIYESSSGDFWVAWGSVFLRRYDSSGQITGEWDDTVIDFPVREILEYDGELLFGTQDGIARYNETNGQWLSTWTPGSGMPSSSEEIVMDLYVEGSDLWVGTAGSNWWGNPQDPMILRLDSSATWNTWDGGQGSIPNGFPISFARCDDILHVVMSNSFNGGVARYDLNTGSWTNSWTQSGGDLSDDAPSAVTCDDQDVLYIGYYQADAGVDRYDYQSTSFISQIDRASNGISSDRTWWDSIEWSSGKLAIGHGVGTTGGANGGTEVGGFSILSASGNSAGQATVMSVGASVTSFLSDLGDFWIGQAGGSSGYSKIDFYNSQLGLNTIVDLPGLVNGNVGEFISNGTHVWVVTASSQSIGQGVLQGIILPNGSVNWEFGWSNYGGEIEEITLQGGFVWATINGRGLVKLDPQTGLAMLMPSGLHNILDGIEVYNGNLVVGLQGSWSSSAGIGVFNPATHQWVAGRLLSGLPSNIINDFAIIDDIAYFATDGGIGLWNITSEEWMDSLTTMDGLPTNAINSLSHVSSTNSAGSVSSILYIGTSAGLARMDMVNGTFLSTMTTQDGLIGNSVVSSLVWGSQSSGGNLFIAHDGAGSTRPGVTEIDVTTDSVVDIHRIDQIPSNNVLALAADWWGLHIATDEEPMVHWNSATLNFEDGASSWQMNGWPVDNLKSDGNHLIATTYYGITLLDISGMGHAVLGRHAISETTNAFASNAGYWVTTDSGLYGWGPAPAFKEYDRLIMRRAIPLSAKFIGANSDISTKTHPGMDITLINSSNPQTVPQSGGTPGPNGISMIMMPLILSSPVSKGATWAASKSLNYSGTWWLNETDSDLTMRFQNIIDGSLLQNGSRNVVLRLFSPNNGSLQFRISYDWLRTDSPVDIQELYDRPNDGGGALIANWSMVNDVDFSRYLIFLNEGSWSSMPTVPELMARNPDSTVSIYTRTSTSVSSADSSPLQDGVDYWAVIVTEYIDGRWGPISSPFGPANSSDEVPSSPVWAEAGPNEGGEVGELFVEWGRCDALDLVGTKIYHSNTMINDVIGMTSSVNVPNSQGNSTIISLEAGNPYWIGLTCYDEAGQEDKANAMIIGPVVPTGGLNDGIPPSRIEGVWADDVPDDEGGLIEVGWTLSTAEDCAFYTIYIMEVNLGIPVNEDGVPFNVDDFLIAEIITDCDTNGTIISSIDGDPLVDGRPYWFAVVASDDWLNEDKGNVHIVEATPLRNLINVNTPPERIQAIDAWDVPNDDGNAIEVQWTADDSNDFAYYIVWVADRDVSDLEELHAKYSPDLVMCGCIKVQNQRNGDSDKPLTEIVTEALYGGTSLVDASQSGIVPDVELFVTITVHDIKGNVHLDNLESVDVTPINNNLDETAPERIETILLADYAGDSGDKLVLTFELSDESDVAEYRVYAATWNFEGEVGPGLKGPNNAILTLDRNPALPLVLDEIFDDPLIPGLMVHVAVVVVDSSGKAHYDGLTMASAAPVDNLGDDPGAHLPTIANLQVEWVSEGSRILVSWSPTGDTAVQSFKVYISNEEFDNVDDADLVETAYASNSIFITSENHLGLDNETTWWIGVSTSECGESYPDCPIYRRAISPLSLSTPNSETSTEEEAKSAEGGFDLSKYATVQNILATALGLAILVLLVVLVKGNGRGRKASQWDLESTWGVGIQPRGDWDDDFDALAAPAPDMSASIMSAAQNIQSSNAAPLPDMNAKVPTSTSPGMDYSGLTGDLLGETPKKEGIDTSFLDDLL